MHISHWRTVHQEGLWPATTWDPSGVLPTVQTVTGDRVPILGKAKLSSNAKRRMEGDLVPHYYHWCLQLLTCCQYCTLRMPVSNKPIVQKTHKVFACLQRTDAETINRGVSTQVSQTNHKEPYKIQQGRSKSQSLPNLQLNASKSQVIQFQRVELNYH